MKKKQTKQNKRGGLTIALIITLPVVVVTVVIVVGGDVGVNIGVSVVVGCWVVHRVVVVVVGWVVRLKEPNVGSGLVTRPVT